MSRSEHDQFIDDDEEETCPLCVEEFDLSDKNFRPCPCGYQICQFCYNNIKTTMNGLCPACRRKYDDKNIEWKVVSAEEMASYRADQAQQAKKKAAAKQKEAQRREADSLSLKHLAGMRVVQKNLVYVTGLSPTIREDQLLQTLRGDQYFGQYGKIVKIVVSKAKDTSHPQQSVGVYVTFARKEDAESCITAVDGSQNGDRVLRAQYGTTKYCSAYLRGETCNNRNCMFLHEPGEANESFTRQDLSSRNSKPTQQPAQSQNNPSHPPQPQPPPQQAPQSIAAAKRPDSKDGGNATDGGGDGPALPSTANWGNKSNQAHQRRASHATTESAASPTVLTSAPAVSTTEPNKSKAEGKKPVKEQDRQSETVEISSSTPQQVAAKPSIPFRMSSSSMPHLERCCKVIAENYSKKYTYNPDGIKGFTEEDKKIVENFPDLFDIENGPRLYVQRRERAAREKQQAEARAAAQVAAQTADTTGDQEEHPEGGSLQLGGEPEERQDMSAGQSQHAIQPPSQQQLLGLNRNYPLSEDFTNLGPGNRGLTPQQQQQILLQQFKTSNSNANTLLNPQASSQQAQGQSQPYAPGHARQTSRFSFANDSASASANIKPVGNAKLMNQQAAMMPQNTSHSNFISQPQSAGNHFFSSGVQGPPPGLKTTGTPPVSGGGMFGQGHGFATSTIGYGANAAARSSNEEMMRELLRGRGANTSVQDPAKRGVVNDLADPSVLQARLHQGGGVSMGGQGIYAGQGQGDDDFPPLDSTVKGTNLELVETSDGKHGSISRVNKQTGRSTPSIPPGFQGVSKAPSDIARPHGPPSTVKSAVHVLSTPSTQPQIPFTPTKKIDAHKSRILSPDSSDKLKVEDEVATSMLGEKSTSNEKNNERTALKNNKQTSNVQNVIESKETSSSKTGANGSQVLETTPKRDAKSTKKPQEKETTGSQSPVKSTNEVEMIMESPERVPMVSGKKQHPGKLDIAAATRVPQSDKRQVEQSSKTDTASKTNKEANMTPFVSSRPETPAGGSTGSPIKKVIAQPKIIKLVTTPKLEAIPSNSAPAISTPAMAPPPVPANPSAKLRSRQASIASVNIPGTPVSELVSDSVSLSSASVSRANSPPPSASATIAPIITRKSKSQAKKERQERARQASLEKQMEEAPKLPTEEPLQTPIISHLRKSKKPAGGSSKSISASTSSISRPASPSGQNEPDDGQVKEKDISTKDKPTVPEKTPKESEKQKPFVEKPFNKSPPLLPVQVQSSKKSKGKAKQTEPTQSPSADQALADAAEQLQRVNALMKVTLDMLLKPISSAKHDITAADLPNRDVKPPFSDHEVAQKIKNGETIRYGGADGRTSSRGLITPQGAHLRGLTREQEDRYLELEKMVNTLDKGHPLRFNPSSFTGDVLTKLTETLLTGVGSVAVTTAAALPQTAAQLDRNAKANFDEALNFLNQWVLPTIPSPSGSSNGQGGSKGPTAAATLGAMLSPTHESSMSSLSTVSIGIGIPDPLSAAGIGFGSPISATIEGALPPGLENLTVEALEHAVAKSRKDHEALEKRLNNLIRRNRKMVGEKNDKGIKVDAY